MSAAVQIIAGAAAVALAALSMTRAQPVHLLALMLAAVLALAAGAFALQAGFAAVLLILLYAGAIVVVLVFAVTLLDTGRPESAPLGRPWIAAALAGVAALPLAWPALPGGAAGAATPSEVGALLFGPWMVAVEAASLLLTAAIVGVRALGREDGR